MRELAEQELQYVNGGNPLLAGAGGAILGGVQAYAAGGDAGDVIIGATFGFATGTYSAIAITAKSAYHGVVAVGMAFFGGLAIREES